MGEYCCNENCNKFTVCYDGVLIELLEGNIEEVVALINDE